MQDEEAALKYYNKYKFFSLFRKYKKDYRKAIRDGQVLPEDEYMLLSRVFGCELPIQFGYDLDNIKTLIRKEARKTNVNHKGARIIDLYIDTDETCSFENVEELFESYFELIERLEALFKKVLLNKNK